MSSIFARIVKGEAPADIVYQDELVTAFADINPLAPTHFLIVPNKEIASVNDVTEADEVALGRMFTVARKIAAERGIDQSGYRLIVNCGTDARQEIYYLHMHVVGGRSLGPMLVRRD